MSETVRYSMNNWSPLTVYDRKMRIEDEVNALEEQRIPLIQRKKEIDCDLSEYTNKVKGKHLPTAEYESILQWQTALKKEKRDIEEKLVDLKMQIRKKSSEKERLNIESKKIPSGKVKEMLLETRDKYMQFASDTTRVSSMRAMASKFVEEIQAILKYTE